MDTTLLLVNDNYRLIEHTRKNLSEIRPDWKMFMANSCAQARNICASAPPDAAVLDVGLPDGNGIDLLAELRSENPDLPVIMISGDASMYLRSRAASRGAFGFLEKPYSIYDLADRIEEAVSVLGPSRSRARIKAMPSWKNSCALCALPQERSIALYNSRNYLEMARGFGK